LKKKNGLHREKNFFTPENKKSQPPQHWGVKKEKREKKVGKANQKQRKIPGAESSTDPRNSTAKPRKKPWGLKKKLNEG